jgi:hypothetical protein
MFPLKAQSMILTLLPSLYIAPPPPPYASSSM